MPVNEILAPSYAILHYFTSASPIVGHVVRLYFDTVPELTVDGYKFTAYTDGEHSTGWTLKQIWQQVFARADVGDRVAEYTIGEVEVWSSAEGANVFLGNDTADYSTLTVGTGEGTAAAYKMWVFKSAAKFQFRFTLFEAAASAPQRFALSSPPEEDDDSLEWLMIRSAIGFCTNDGYELAIAGSVNTGYNRKLARSYGRAVIP